MVNRKLLCWLQPGRCQHEQRQNLRRGSMTGSITFATRTCLIENVWTVPKSIFVSRGKLGFGTFFTGAGRLLTLDMRKVIVEEKWMDLRRIWRVRSLIDTVPKSHLLGSTQKKGLGFTKKASKETHEFLKKQTFFCSSCFWLEFVCHELEATLCYKLLVPKNNWTLLPRVKAFMCSIRSNDVHVL